MTKNCVKHKGKSCIVYTLHTKPACTDRAQGARRHEESVWVREVGLLMTQPLGRAAEGAAVMPALTKDAQKTVSDGSYWTCNEYVRVCMHRAHACAHTTHT